MIETTEAISNLDDILTVPGIDAIYVGPADLSISLGLEPYGNDGKQDAQERADPTPEELPSRPGHEPSPVRTGGPGLTDALRTHGRCRPEVPRLNGFASAGVSACRPPSSE